MADKRTQRDDGNAALAQPIAAEDGVLYSHDAHILEKSYEHGKNRQAYCFIPASENDINRNWLKTENF